MSGLEQGSTLGGYKILARLRAGAMGVLYLGRRVGPAGFSRPVAIKVIHEHLAQNKRFARMFIDEAKLSARIDDPNVVRVEEFGEDGGRYYLVMEYVQGASLAQVIGVLRHKGGIPIDLAVNIAMQMASGLHGAHEATDEDGAPLGIVHRDVSPHNVLVSYKGNVRIIDFGIAKARQQGGGHTKTGSLRGKIAYMPPEQARSARTVDRRADLYACGLVLWEMLTGRRVFQGKNEIEILNSIRKPVIVPPSAVAHRVPKALDDVVLATLEQDPNKRPPTGAALQRMLGEAHPPALRVMPADIAALMQLVRTTATNIQQGSEDESGLYGEEVRRHLTIFGKSMHESVELANAALPAPSGPDSVIVDEPTEPGDDDETEAMLGPAVVMEDEPTARQSSAPVNPRVPTMRMSMASVPPPRESQPSLAPQPRIVRPAPPQLPPRANDRTLVLAVLLPLAAALVGAALIVASRTKPSRAQTPPPPSMTVTTTTTTEETPVPPVAPPDESGPAPVASVSLAPKARAMEAARQASLEGRPGEVRRLLESGVRSGHGTIEAARLVRAACKAQGDTVCRDDINAKYPSLAGAN